MIAPQITNRRAKNVRQALTNQNSLMPKSVQNAREVCTRLLKVEKMPVMSARRASTPTMQVSPYAKSARQAGTFQQQEPRLQTFVTNAKTMPIQSAVAERKLQSASAKKVFICSMMPPTFRTPKAWEDALFAQVLLPNFAV
jgi:hypothetical protein